MIAFDTNVIVYSDDADDPPKQAIAERLLLDTVAKGQAAVLLWQVACEFLDVLRRWEPNHELTATEMTAHFADIRAAFPLVMPTEKVLDRSLALALRYSLSHWDSLLVAAALEAGVTTLYSEDSSHCAQYDTVQVINPFHLP